MATLKQLYQIQISETMIKVFTLFQKYNEESEA